jgi:hypothetical protein
MTEIANTTRLWVVNRHSTFLVLAQGLTGTPRPVEPAPVLYKSAYVQFTEGTDHLDHRQVDLDSSAVMLMARLPNPDGPPAQTAVIFLYLNDETISYVSNGRSFPSIAARAYGAAGPKRGGYGWASDITYGKHGHFLIGDSKSANLWRVSRVEVDYADRYNFTITPIVLAHGLPSADFSVVADPAIRQEIQQHWSELEDALVRQRSYGIVTSAKNVVESLLYYYLLAGSHISPGNRDLADMLKKLESVIKGAQTKTTVPFDFLAYHLMQKIRILHGKTHIGRVVVEGRSIPLQFALTVATDLVEVLKGARLVAM